MVAALTLFILALNPTFHAPQDAAEHLVTIQSAGGPTAALMAAMIAVESEWDPKCRGRAGEVGICQIHPCHHPPDGWTAQMDWAAAKLRTYYERSGSWEAALAAYNGGWGARNSSRCRQYARRVLAKAEALAERAD